MPYAVRKRGSKWATVNKETGKVHGMHDSHEKAMAQMRLLYHVESGGKLTRVRRSGER